MRRSAAPTQRGRQRTRLGLSSMRTHQWRPALIVTRLGVRRRRRCCWVAVVAVVGATSLMAVAGHAPACAPCVVAAPLSARPHADAPLHVLVWPPSKVGPLRGEWPEWLHASAAHVPACPSPDELAVNPAETVLLSAAPYGYGTCGHCSERRLIRPMLPQDWTKRAAAGAFCRRHA